MTVRAPDLNWPATAIRTLARRLWPHLLWLVNRSEPMPSQAGQALRLDTEGRPASFVTKAPATGPARDRVARLRDTLKAIVEGSHAPPNRTLRLPRLGMRDGVVYWRVKDPEWLLSDAAITLYEFEMALLWHPSVRPLLHRCTRCGRFDLLRARPKKMPYLCSPTCKKAQKRQRDAGTNPRRQKAMRAREKARDADALTLVRRIARNAQ